jgi:hypothetical protein
MGQEETIDRRDEQTTRGRPPVAQSWILLAIVGILLLLAGIAWLVNLEQTLPDIRTPRDPSSSAALPGHGLLMPGTTSILDVDPELEGDWVNQEIGDADWLATDLRGSGLRAAFYGTDLYLLARVGPDASRAYVTVNNQRVDHLLQDDIGSYVNLWSSQTSDQPILLGQNLAHGEHVVHIVADGDGELALSGFTVDASIPFPWAFALGYIGLSSGIFLLVRAMFYGINSQSRDVRRQVPARQRMTRA